jgi:eukaryotic-like serine/threonine-protein kinase
MRRDERASGDCRTWSAAVPLTCPDCSKAIEFTGERPGFCPYCGRRLPPAEQIDATATAAWQGSTAGDAGGGGAAAPARTVGDYQLVRELGHGGMGVVWEAEQAGTGRRVALKLLSPRIPHSSETVDRFLREARLAASLSHPRSTFVFGAGQEQGRPYIAMELMPGRTLKHVVEEEGVLSVPRAVDAILDVIEGLEAAHALGIVHRDVKPSNCFLDGDSRVKVGDFGLSKSLVSDSGLTRTGAFLGTPQFASPEQVRGGEIDARTDVYAVGATLMYLLTGRGPFEGDPAAVIAKIASEPAPDVSTLRADIPKPLARVIARTLEKDPQQRPVNLRELAASLRPFASGGSSIADVGRRLAAYMLDEVATGIIGGALALALQLAFAAERMGASVDDSDGSVGSFMRGQIGGQLLSTLAPILYFALAEGIWACTPGKWLMGLRVTDARGHAPGLGRAFLRAFVLPGALGLSFLAPLYLGRMVIDGLPPETTFTIREAVVTSLAEGPAFIFMLLCLTSMRARNGYRGWHDWLSGTRVVRLRPAAARPVRGDAPVVVATDGGGDSYGPYRVVGRMGSAGAAAVWSAHDSALGREVWVYVGPLPWLSRERMQLTRTTRPRWLQGRTEAAQWNAFEAVRGAPLAAQLADRGGMDWNQSRFVLADLAGELAAATRDGTFPAKLSLEQIWVDQGGRVRLLDEPLRPLAVPAGPDTVAAAAPPAERALALLREAVRACVPGQILPGHAQRIVEELPSRAANQDTLDWAARELQEATEDRAALRWDDRLGILGVSMGTELSAVLAVSILLPFVVLWSAGVSMACAVASVAATLLLPAIAGFAFRGGPVFRFLGIEVRRVDGRPAGRWRCAWRSLAAWGPLQFFYGGLGVVVAVIALGLLAPERVSDDTTTGRMTSFSFTSDNVPNALVLSLACGAELMLLLFLIGVVVAVVRPRRGLQDIVAGTCLAPR